jgi:hypothetical protein
MECSKGAPFLLAVNGGLVRPSSKSSEKILLGSAGDRCYHLKNIFAKKIGEKIAVFD